MLRERQEAAHLGLRLTSSRVFFSLPYLDYMGPSHTTRHSLRSELGAIKHPEDRLVQL